MNDHRLNAEHINKATDKIIEALKEQGYSTKEGVIISSSLFATMLCSYVPNPIVRLKILKDLGEMVLTD